MVTLDPEPGEQLPRYLARALLYSRHAGEPVRCVFDDIAFVLRPTMTDEEAHAAWLYAKRPLRSW